MDILQLLDRDTSLFASDIDASKVEINAEIAKSSFLVLGGAGSIGKEVSEQLFKRGAKALHVVDLSENNLVELVRHFRSKYGYNVSNFKTCALDIGSIEFEYFFRNQPTYDYVLNLSAMKHVRSEKDPYSIMRLIEVNIMNTQRSLDLAIKSGCKKYFCVSSDKATNPVNMMGASKRIMEYFLMQKRFDINISTARFANVAFSNGSLLNSFQHRMALRQPLATPNDIKRYFITPEESGILCLLSCLQGKNGDVYFPKLNNKLKPISFTDIAVKFLNSHGFTPEIVKDECEARMLMNTLPKENKWPCLLTKSNTTGEKSVEEFFTSEENVRFDQYADIGIINNNIQLDPKKT